MNIGNASECTGLSAKTLRYYEDIELVSPARSANGYRRYSSRDVQQLQFLQRARQLGFSIDECRQLLSLFEDKERASADVKALAMDKIESVTKKIAELQTLQKSLTQLANACSGDENSDCPIIDNLASGGFVDKEGP